MLFNVILNKLCMRCFNIFNLISPENLKLRLIPFKRTYFYSVIQFIQLFTHSLFVFIYHSSNLSFSFSFSL